VRCPKNEYLTPATVPGSLRFSFAVNARPAHEVHLKEMTLTATEKYDQPTGCTADSAGERLMP
jgi:hypothetical protein